MRLPITALATALLVSILPASTCAQTGIGVLDIWLKVRESADAPNDKKVTLYTKSKALVIGMDHYDGHSWPRLSNRIRDAEEVAKALAAHGFEVTLKKDLKSEELDRTLKNFFVREGEDCWNESNNGNPEDGRARASGDCSHHVLRGGSYGVFPGYVRAAFRWGSSSDFAYLGRGSRVARTLTQ